MWLSPARVGGLPASDWARIAPIVEGREFYVDKFCKSVARHASKRRHSAEVSSANAPHVPKLGLEELRKDR